jgi:hypothetical protein
MEFGPLFKEQEIVKEQEIGYGRAVVLVVDTNILVYAADENPPFHTLPRLA